MRDKMPPPAVIDEGGLRAPPGLTGWRKAWWWFDFIILVKLARLRFIAVLVVIGAVITQWDLLAAYYDKWTRPTGAAAAASSDVEWFCPMHPSVVRDNPREKGPLRCRPLPNGEKGGGGGRARSCRQLVGRSDDQIDEILATGKGNTHLKIRSPISGHVIKKYVREGQYVDEGMPLYDVADLSTVWIQAQVYEDDMG